MTSPTSSASSAGSSSVSADVAAGKLPDDLPPPLEIEAAPTKWSNYDVPRLWSSVKDEVQADAWIQAAGFENLSVLLADHHDRLTTLRESLVQSWDPAVSEAARSFLNEVDALLGALRDDAYVHASTARGLHGILESLRTAKAEVGLAREKWNTVTTDLAPEWWDHAAEKLNEKARSVMLSMDESVGDHRQKILVADARNLLANYSQSDSGVDITSTTDDKGQKDSQGGTPVNRPEPGRRTGRAPSGLPPTANPTSEEPVSPPLSGGTIGPVLTGPPSALPIPPGSPYAPTGGAYMLPDSGLGQGGYMRLMPVPAAMKDEVAAARAVAAREAGARGLTPMPVGTGIGSPRYTESAGTRRPSDVQWEVLQGVPPVIGEVDQDAQNATQEAAGVASLNEVFEEWYANLITPWDKKPSQLDTNGEERS